MQIKNQVYLAVSIILISISPVNSATAQTQVEPSNVNQELEKLQREKEIEDIVQDEVDRIIGVTFENTINLINLNIAILSGLAGLVALFLVFISFTAWWIRGSFIKALENEMKE